MMMDTLSMFSLGMSNTSASLYVGFSVFFLMEVFLFFSLRPSQIREAFTYGSDGETRGRQGRWEGWEKKRVQREEKQEERGRWDENQRRRRRKKKRRGRQRKQREKKIRGDSRKRC